MVGLICEHRSRCGLCPAAAVPGVVLHESEILACGVVLAGVTTVGHCRYVLVMLLARASVEVRVVIDRHGAFVGIASLTWWREREVRLLKKHLAVGHACYCCHACCTINVNANVPVSDTGCGQDGSIC